MPHRAGFRIAVYSLFKWEWRAVEPYGQLTESLPASHAGVVASRASRERTVVFTDGAGRFGLLICKSATLAETARILATPALLAGRKITRALNLDGGSSTALWVKQEPEPYYSREWKGVRNYLAIVPRI